MECNALYMKIVKMVCVWVCVYMYTHGAENGRTKCVAIRTFSFLSCSENQTQGLMLHSWP